jgi:hypothetical protein
VTTIFTAAGAGFLTGFLTDLVGAVAGAGVAACSSDRSPLFWTTISIPPKSASNPIAARMRCW